ncbi:MAG: DUF533 domain-containing protein [Labilithrix sp.]|nr:DUF533 domain-containing protein [Labilithrix sp.]MCW5815273.1 DUF533 domain-containing protein [Labilithrix sp.]
MAITESEALASLRILVAIAHADGTVHEDERRSLAAAIESLELTKGVLGGVTVDSLLAEPVDVDGELALLESEEARAQIYRSAYFMANADGACTPDEQVLLEKIAAHAGTTDAERATLDRIFVGRASREGGPLSLAPIAPLADAGERSAEVRKRALRYAVLTAALGAFPIPGLAIATDLAVVAVQLKMIRDVGALWGHTLDAAAAKTLLYGVGLGTGARLAVNNLAKLIPGWGSVIGATTSFVSTYALATVIDKVFADGQVPATAKPEDLRARFRAAEEIARSVYKDQEEVIIASQRANSAVFDALSEQLSEGVISQEEFDRKVAELA